LSVAEKEKADTDFLAHIPGTKNERAQYAKDQIKCSEEDDKFVIIMDSIDKYKTTFPFFINPPKSVLEGQTLVSTNLPRQWFMALVQVFIATGLRTKFATIPTSPLFYVICL